MELDSGLGSSAGVAAEAVGGVIKDVERTKHSIDKVNHALSRWSGSMDWRVKVIDAAMGTVVLASATALLLHGHNVAGGVALGVGLLIAMIE